MRARRPATATTFAVVALSYFGCATPHVASYDAASGMVVIDAKVRQGADKPDKGEYLAGREEAKRVCGSDVRLVSEGADEAPNAKDKRAQLTARGHYAWTYHCVTAEEDDQQRPSARAKAADAGVEASPEGEAAPGEVEGPALPPSPAP